MNKSVSPSRTYVAMCSRSNFDGYYFRRFALPEYRPETRLYDIAITSESLENNSDVAAWYFLNHLNFSACIDGCIAAEDFADVTDQRPWGQTPEAE